MAAMRFAGTASIVASLLLAGVVPACARGEDSAGGLAAGQTFAVSGGNARLTRLESVPYVENDYAKRFRFDSAGNPKLKVLRERYRLDDVVSPGKDEFEKQLLLLDWVNHRFKKFGKPSSPARGALDILEAIDQGHSFFCAHYADVFVSAAASMGWVDRSLALRRPDNVGDGSTEHSSTEIWSNQYRKWVMLDPTFAMYVEKGGTPLNAWEIRREWFYNDAKDITFVLDKERRRYRKSDMPVFRGRYENFGDLVLDGGALNPYAFIGYIPNTNLLDSGPDYGRMFIAKDRLCDTTKWHVRDNPADPATEPYFPINQATLSLAPGESGLGVAVRTFTPNFKSFVARTDGGAWAPAGSSFPWRLHAGTNKLEVKTVNQFGVEGPVSTAQVDVAGR